MAAADPDDLHGDMAGDGCRLDGREATVVEPCDEGGEAPCFAHLLEDDTEHEGDRADSCSRSCPTSPVERATLPPDGR